MIEGTLSREQRRVYDKLEHLISDKVLVEPLTSDTIMLSGHVINSFDIEAMFEMGLIVYYLKIGKLAVYYKRKY